MSGFKNTLHGNFDLQIRGSQTPHELAPFGAELLTAMDPQTVKNLGGSACVQSLSTQVDDSTVAEEPGPRIHGPFPVHPEEITSIF